jgi:CRISPR-associated protein Csb1
VPVEDGPPDSRTGETDVRTSGRRTGSRIDPLGVLRRVEVFKGQDGWDTAKERAGKGAKAVRPSEINRGNIAPTVQPLGVTCDHAEHTAVLSFAGLRRLGFGGGPKDEAGRTLLAALGLVALAEQDARGYALRSRCDLVCDGRAPFELVHADGRTEKLEIGREAARAVHAAAHAAAGKAGFKFPSGPITLTPQEKLVEIVRRSQRLALEGAGGEAEEAE